MINIGLSCIDILVRYIQQTIQMLVDRLVQKIKISSNSLFQKYQSYRLKLFKSQKVGPYWFFFLFLFKHQIQRQGEEVLINWWLFAFNFLLKFNVVFMDAGIVLLRQYILAAVLYVFTLLMCCQTQWQKNIYLFSLGEYLLRGQNYHLLYLLLASIFMAYQIYIKLLASSIEQNKGYFTGFIMVSIHALIFLLQKNLLVDISLIAQAIVILLCFLLSNWIFDLKINTLNDLTSKDIQNKSYLFQLRKFREDITSLRHSSSKLKNHIKNCSDPACPCHFKTIDSKMLLKHSYEKALEQKGQNSESLLYQDYFHFLIQCKQHLRAFIFTAQQHPNSADGEWMIKKLCAYIEQLKKSNVMERQFEYVLRHDKLRVEMADRMIKIVQQKLKFWGEVSHDNPRMVKLQQWSHSIQHQMKQLNKFYNEQIDQIEESLINFDSTILFATFLLSSTNFKQHAQQIIKNTTKRLDESLSAEKYSSQIYALTVIFNQKGKLLLSSIDQLEKSSDLIIQSVNSSFLRMCKQKKQSFIGQSINLLIPECYRKIHGEMLQQYFYGSSDERTQLPNFNHSNGVVVPVLLGQGALFMMELHTKIIVHLENSINFICLLRKSPEKMSTALVSLDGKMLSKQYNFPTQLLDAIQNRKLFQSIKNDWQNDKIIQEQLFEIVLKQTIYNITVCSPFHEILANFQFLQIPLHLKVLGDGQKKPANHINNQQKMAHKVKHMQNAIKSDSQSTQSSKDSISAVKILSTFSQRNSVKIYRNIYIYYIGLITLALGTLIGAYISNNLPWDNSTQKMNPLVDIQRLQRMQHITIHALGYKVDLDWRQSQSDFDQKKITPYFNEQYLTYSQIQLKELFMEYNELIYLATTQHSNQLADELDRRYAVVFDVANFTVQPSSIQNIHQNITFQSLLMNYLVDLNLMVYGQTKNLVVMLSFDNRVRQLISCTKLSEIIIERIIERRQQCLILLIVSLVVIMLLLIPMWLLLKDRLVIHQKTFDLMTSIQPRFIQMQMDSLEYVKNIIKHHSQSTQVLKNNVIGYEQKVIYPKPTGSQRSSITNQLVQGLEKYDKARQESPLIKGEDNLSNVRNVFSIYNANKPQASIVRRRVTELDLSQSQSDPSKRFILSHLPFYLIVMTLLPIFLHANASFETHIASTIGRINEITNLLLNHSQMQSSLLCVKKYIRNGLGNSAHFCTNNWEYQNVESYLNLIDSVRLQVKGSFERYSQIRSDCSPEMQNDTICKLGYSYRILQGQLLALSKEFIQSRASLQLILSNQQDNESISLSSSNLKQLNYRAYYLQTLSGRIDKLYHQILQELTYDTMIQNSDYKAMLVKHLLLGIMVWAFAMIFGICWIWSLKRKYFNEVYSLTFLSDQMVLSNKRVQSFLQALHRSSL